jgi:fluoride ion exporter CrcB/FEX
MWLPIPPQLRDGCRLAASPFWHEGGWTGKRLFFAIGFLGAYTTFSTFSFESVALLQHRSFSLALANMVLSVVLGLVAVVMGMALAKFF